MLLAVNVVPLIPQFIFLSSSASRIQYDFKGTKVALESLAWSLRSTDPHSLAPHSTSRASSVLGQYYLITASLRNNYAEYILVYLCCKT